MGNERLPIVDVDVLELRLDLENYRIAGSLPSEAAAIAYLFDAHGALELATQILREGYVDLEMPLVYEDEGKYVVLEGNRRVTALRALLDPSAAPGSQAEIERLLKKNALEAENLPTTIRVMVCEKREDAARILARLHIGQSKKPWDLDDQARFVVAQIRAGLTIDDVRRELPGIKDPLTLIRHYAVRDVLKRAPFEDPKVLEFASGPKLRMAAFEYAYSNPEVQAVIGLAFDRNGQLVAEPSGSDQVAALERLVDLYRVGGLNTRTFPRKKSSDYDARMDDLIRKLRGESPVVGAPRELAFTTATSTDDKVGSATGDRREPAQSGVEGDLRAGSVTSPTPRAQAETSIVDNAPSSTGIALPPDESGSGSAPHAGVGAPLTLDLGRGPNRPETRNFLTVSLSYDHAPAGIQNRLIELRGIDVSRFPVASAVLMRVVLETTIKMHFAVRNQSSVTGELAMVMKSVDSSYGKDGRVKNAISLLMDRQGPQMKPGSGKWFNAAAHDPNVVVTQGEVHQAWQQLEPVVRLMLEPVSAQQS